MSACSLSHIRLLVDWDICVRLFANWEIYTFLWFEAYALASGLVSPPRLYHMSVS